MRGGYQWRSTAHSRAFSGLPPPESPPNGEESHIFNRAVDIGDDLEMREWAMFMILVARCLERIAGNTIDIAEQTVFVVTGLFRELADQSQPA